MPAPLAHLVCSLLLGQVPPALGPAPGPNELETTADLLRIDAKTRHTLLHGHATLRTGGLLLRADDITYDPETRTAEALGQVALAEIGRASCRERV